MTEHKFQPSEGLAREISIRAGKITGTLDLLAAADTFDEFVRSSNKSLVIDHVRAVTRDWVPGSKVLDVGFGNGYSSLFLSQSGFAVTGVEPSGVDVEAACRASEKFSLPFTAVNSTGEEMGRSVNDRFDYVLFNSCLHHCDDPVRALRSAHSLLRPGGTVTFIEPVLKPWRTKRWYYRQLEEDPVRMGHYGGNEHIYYSWEYSKMLKDTGFTDLRTTPSLGLQNIRNVLLMKAQAKIDGHNVFSTSQLAQRAIYYAALESLLKSGIATRAYMRMSLGDGVWTARKPANSSCSNLSR